ncbi:MAG TPA: methyltransferase domain-containing protein [Xanthomonadales bacterium]|nr:methyltransferase domain-containing protein [Xanthomonadales bacterium]
MTESTCQKVQQGQFDAIVEYYDHSWFDYWFLWLNPGNLAVHFGYYDENTRSHSGALENLNRVLADLAEIQPGNHVLDAGCGIGGSSIWLAEHCDAKVVGIAPVQSQLVRARKSVLRRKVGDHVHLVCGDYANTSFPDQTFDVVWAMESLCHAPSKASVYKEFFRILKPGGRLVIAEYMRKARPLDAENEQLVNDWLTSWAIPDIDTAAHHEQVARAAGFREIVNRNVTAQVEPSLRRLYRLSLLGKPADRLLKKMGFRRRTRNVDGAQKQFLALQNKAWFYSIQTARKA